MHTRGSFPSELPVGRRGEAGLRAEDREGSVHPGVEQAREDHCAHSKCSEDSTARSRGHPALPGSQLPQLAEEPCVHSHPSLRLTPLPPTPPTPPWLQPRSLLSSGSPFPATCCTVPWMPHGHKAQPEDISL